MTSSANDGYRYLASPYTGPKEIMTQRFHDTKRAVSVLLGRKLWVYSPIVHCHQMAEDHDLPTDFQFWLAYNHAMIRQASAVWVLALAGWSASKGVAEEIAYAEMLGKELCFVVPSTGHGVIPFPPKGS